MNTINLIEVTKSFFGKVRYRSRATRVGSMCVETEQMAEIVRLRTETNQLEIRIGELLVKNIRALVRYRLRTIASDHVYKAHYLSKSQWMDEGRALLAYFKVSGEKDADTAILMLSPLPEKYEAGRKSHGGTSRGKRWM